MSLWLSEQERVQCDQWDTDRCLRQFRAALRDRSAVGAEQSMRAMDRLGCWHEALEQLISPTAIGDVAGESVLWFWISYGFHISDSLERGPILATVLKTLLPPYTGPRQIVYRGEAADRHLARAYGMSWTIDIKVARMFAERRDPRGIVLKLDASAEMIIAGPDDHSKHLQEDEYLVDPSTIRSVEEIW